MRRSALLLALVLVPACGGGPSKRDQIDAFTDSVRRVQQATVLSNAQMAGDSTTETKAKLKAELEGAISQSAVVTDPVLASLHPELPQQYRTLLLPALHLRLESLKSAGAEDGLTRQLEWQKQLGAWGEWYDAHVDALRQKLR